VTVQRGRNCGDFPFPGGGKANSMSEKGVDLLIVGRESESSGDHAWEKETEEGG